MLDLVQSFQAELSQQPLWVQIWVNWLALLNTAGLLFVFSRTEVRWTLLAWVVAFTGVLALYQLQGFTRLLGLGHIIAWTPLLIYLWRRRGEIYLTMPSGIYLHLIFLSNGISLAFDYADLVRYFMGHGY